MRVIAQEGNPMGAKIRRLTHEAWTQEARLRFGKDPREWKFVCPSCGHVASAREWKAAGASEGEVAFSCIGRLLPEAKTLGEKPGPCNYAGGGLFKLNPVRVTMPDGRELEVFEFASAGEAPCA